MSTAAFKVVFLDAGTLPQRLRFDPALPIAYEAHGTTADDSIVERIADTDVVVTNKIRLTADRLRAAPRLRLICVAAAGTDNVDLETASERGIEVRNVPDYGSDSVAEHVIATLMALRRGLGTYAQAATDGRWSSAKQFCWLGPVIRDVGGTVMGVVGRGRIGEATARLARGLGMTVLFARTPGQPCAPDERELDQLVPMLTEIDGAPLPPSNFVVVDASGILWFTVSTRRLPRSLAWTPNVADGYIGVVDASGVARIVADGLAYTNEVAFSPDGQWLYTNETYGQCVSRFRLLPGPGLGPREVVVQLEGADLPDGICFDAQGGAWIACIASNRLLCVSPGGQVHVVLADTDDDHAQRVARGIRSANLRHADMQTAGRSRLGNISSLAFGGPDRRTAYLGCLLDHRIRCFTAPVQGAEPAHWHRRLREA